MGAVTVLAVIVLAIGYRYHLRLERLLQTTESARYAETQERRRAENFLYFNRMALAEREWTANNIDRVERLLEDCPESLRGWEWRYLQRQCDHSLLSLNHALPSPQSWTVTCVRYSPDGRLLASSSKDGTVRLWDSATGRAIRLLGKHKHYAFSLAFQPGSQLLASGGDEGDILIWDTTTGSLVRTLPKSTDTIYALAYSPDGGLLVSGHGYPPREEANHMRGHGVVRCWEASTGRLIRTLCGHTQNVMGVAFSPDGQILASVSGSSIAVPQAASKPGELMLHKTRTGEPVRVVRGHGGPLTGVAYHPDGSLIATSSWDRTIKLWDASTGDLRQSLLGHDDWVLHVEFSPDGSRIASGGADGAIKIWETASNQELYTLRGHKQNVTCVAFSPDSRRLASTSSDQTVKVWDATANPEVLTWRGTVGPIARIAFFPDGHRLLVAGNSEDSAGRLQPRLTIVDTTNGMYEDTLEDANGLQPDRPIDGIAVRPDGRLVAAASQSGRIEAWTAGTHRSCFHYEENTSRFQAVGFSPDGRKLATAGQINARLENGEPGPINSDAIGLVIVFDLDTGIALWRRAGLTTSIIRDLTFSPDGQLLATADNASTVTLWNVATGEMVHQLRGHRRLVSHVVFSPTPTTACSSWPASPRRGGRGRREARGAADALADEVVAFVRAAVVRLDLQDEFVEVVLGGGVFDTSDTAFHDRVPAGHPRGRAPCRPRPPRRPPCARCGAHRARCEARRMLAPVRGASPDTAVAPARR